MSILELTGVSRWFGNVVAVNDITQLISARSTDTPITAASVELSAVLADRQMTIRDLQALGVGETVTFPASPPLMSLPRRTR